MNNQKLWAGATFSLLFIFTIATYISTRHPSKKINKANPYRVYSEAKNAPIKQIKDTDKLAGDVAVVTDREIANYLDKSSQADDDLTKYIQN